LQSAILNPVAAFVTDKIGGRDRVLQGAWLLLALIVFGLVIAIRIRLLGIPLDSAEGEYAYAGQLMLQGIPPYKLAYNMKFPGTYAAYAGIMSIFGQTITGIHLGLLLVNAATVTLIFVLGRRLVNSTAGIAAAMTYAVLSVGSSVFGLAAHATHFVMLPVLGGTLLLLKQSGGKAVGRVFGSGVLFGIGLLMKQPAVFFILFGAIYLLSNDIRLRFGPKSILSRNLIFGAGAILPFGITCLLLWYAGVFDKFWFWTIDYARQYGGLVPLTQAPKIFAENVGHVIGAGWALWTLAGLALFAGLWHKETRANTGFLLGLLASSALALSAGYYFRAHYFILILPAVSLLVGLATSKLSELTASHTSVVRFVPFLLFGTMVSLPIFSEKKFFFEVSPVEACLMIYARNPFPESIKIAEYVHDHTSPTDTIAVLGSEPQIYFYSKRHSATGYICTYSLMEAQSFARQMQEEMIREIELARPKYLIFVGMGISWLRHPESEQLIFTWANEYIRRHYEIVGAVNITTSDRFDPYFVDRPKSVLQPANYVSIYKRKNDLSALRSEVNSNLANRFVTETYFEDAPYLFRRQFVITRQCECVKGLYAGDRAALKQLSDSCSAAGSLALAAPAEYRLPRRTNRPIRFSAAVRSSSRF
jgi:hypothetical protein